MGRNKKLVGSARPSARPLARLRLHSAVEFMPHGMFLLIRFKDKVQAGTVPDFALLQDLAQRFQKIIDGMPAERALGLQPARGRTRTVNQQYKEQDIADDVTDLYQKLGRGTLKQVFATVGLRHHKSASAVKKIYLKYKLAKRRQIAESPFKNRTKK